MFHTGQNKLKLLARNEGKIKTYESCSDVRAWSHDIQARDRYIRDWIRSDMPICIFPVSTVSNCLRTMTWRCRERSTPRCHPNCKSKLVLESICNSCHAIKECLKSNENFEKYFDEEEFETSHWPCEKCLEALKSIKMFWKIIMERIFKISIPKKDDFEDACCSNESVQSVAKMWQEQLVHQALVVKNLTPLLNTQSKYDKSTYCWKSYKNYLKKIITFDNLRFVVEDDDFITVESEKSNEKFIETICSFEDKATETDPVRPSDTTTRRRCRFLTKQLNKCTSFRVKTVDFGVDACKIDDEDNNMYKNNLDYLQQQYNMQNDELNKLKIENTSLKLQLVTKNSAPSHYTMVNSDNSACVIPIPYESYVEKEESVKDIDSEMIITLKNCENENFKHVSMLQVLHKTNISGVIDEVNENNCCKKKQDPIKILTKVHNTFGAIVERELTIANKRKSDPKEVEIDASSYQKVKTVHPSKSIPFCSTVSSRSSVSDIFVSTTEVKDL